MTPRQLAEMRAVQTELEAVMARLGMRFIPLAEIEARRKRLTTKTESEDKETSK